MINANLLQATYALKSSHGIDYAKARLHTLRDCIEELLTVKEYKAFVIRYDAGFLDAHSGWEYASDAQDAQDDICTTSYRISRAQAKELSLVIRNLLWILSEV